LVCLGGTSPPKQTIAAKAANASMLIPWISLHLPTENLPNC